MQVRIQNLTIGNGNIINHISHYGEVREIVINAEHDKVEAVAVFSFVEESPELLTQLVSTLNGHQERTRIEQPNSKIVALALDGMGNGMERT